MKGCFIYIYTHTHSPPFYQKFSEFTSNNLHFCVGKDFKIISANKSTLKAL